VSHCVNCGHALGLRRPIWWWNAKFCSHACKTVYKARWRRDLGRRPLSALRRISGSRVRQEFMRLGIAISAVAFFALAGTVLVDQWISGKTSARFMLGTAALIVGSCIGLFAIVGTLGLAISAAFAEERATRPEAIRITERDEGVPG
jgi:hypothetical protein